MEEVIELAITHRRDFNLLSYIIKFLNKFPQKSPRLQPSILDVSRLLTNAKVVTSGDTWDALQRLERVLLPPLFLGRDVRVLHWTMGAIYGTQMARYVIGLFARFRRAEGATFGVQEWFDDDFVLEDDTSDSEFSDSETSSNTQETLVDSEKAESFKTAEEPAFVPLPKILLWDTAKLDLPLMGASTILSFGCWPRMRHLTLNLAVPTAWPGKTALEIAQVLALTLFRISFLFPSLEALRLSTTTVPSDSMLAISQAVLSGQEPFEEETLVSPMDPTLYPKAIASLGPKALVQPLPFLARLDVRAIPMPLLLTFAPQWTCRTKERNIKVSFRSGGWIVPGEEEEYNQLATFSDEFSERAEFARENDMETNWVRGYDCRKEMTGKTKEELARVVPKVRINVTIKG